MHLSNQMLLNASCFGHFLAIPDIQFQGQLYVVLIRKLERSSLACMRLVFRINDRVIEFEPHKFSLMIELRMDGWKKPPMESVFHKTFFHGKTKLLFCDIQKSFVQECIAIGGESRNAFMLVLLHILYGILLIYAWNGKKIDLKYLHLVDDLEKFNYYGWGQVAYEFLMRTTHHTRDIMDNLIVEEKNLAFDANDFAITLQIWAYEVMPDLACVCTQRVPNWEEEIPRILRWAAEKPCRFHLVNNFFAAKNGSAAFVEEVGNIQHVGDDIHETESQVVSDVAPQKNNFDMESQCTATTKVDDGPGAIRWKRIHKPHMDIIWRVISTWSQGKKLVAQHDPRDMEINHVRITNSSGGTKFHRGKSCKFDNILLPTGIAADADWFASIWGRRGWLHDDVRPRYVFSVSCLNHFFA
ncbi:hypothetical protein C2S51_031993 [Perilla frutescens var. frutescens]|nr:hypothetical protein C2S51_031993 [Perilla frutescens var. frutescens]